MADVLLHDATAEPLRAVTPDGRPDGSWGLDPSAVLDRIPELYAEMVVTRELDEEFVNLQRQGQIALYPSCRGQEAAQIGCASALRDTDWMFPQYRELGAFLHRGVDPGGIGLSWRGTWNGGLGFVERCIAPICIAIATQTLHAVGAALASTWLDDDGVTVAFVGDGGTSEGDWHEALNLAAVRQAPCIVFVQNNGWAISTPTSQQFRSPTIAERATGYGMPGVRVDGNDVVACHLVVAEAAERARRGEGPTLIEAVTYRMGPHTTSDDPRRYRTDHEVEQWSALDPVARSEAHLRHLGRWDDEIRDGAMRRAADLRSRLRDAVVDAPDAPISEVFDHVFVEPTPALLDQRDQLIAELERED